MHRGLESAAHRFGDRVAIRSGDESWTWGELDHLADTFSRHLTNRGVAPGDRVAIMTSNRVEFVAAVQGVSKLGGAAVLLSPAWKAAEVDHALGLTDPRHAVADGDAVFSLATGEVGLAVGAQPIGQGVLVQYTIVVDKARCQHQATLFVHQWEATLTQRGIVAVVAQFELFFTTKRTDRSKIH